MSRFTEFVNQTAEKERKNHYIVNIMLSALLALVMIFCLAGGVNIDVGSEVKGDGNEVMVRHNIYQLIDVAFSGMMSKEKAQEFVKKTNRKLLEDYSVVAPLYSADPLKDDYSQYFDELAQLYKMIGNEEGQITAKEASKINFLKYKFAYAMAIGDSTKIEHSVNWAGHIAVTLAGQAILMIMPQLFLLIVSVVMLIYSVIALIKKKENKRAKLSLILLGMGTFINILLFFVFGFYTPDVTGILTIILVPLAIAAYTFIAHTMMEKKDFSKSMFIHNGLILLGSLLAFILFMSPVFKVVDNDGVSMLRGWSYVFDVSLADGMYFSTPMAYFLLSVLLMVLILPGILFMIFSLVHIYKFMSCNYGHNEVRVKLILIAAVNLLIFILVGALATSGAIKSSSYYLGAKASLNAWFLVIETIVLGGMIALEYLYKVKPVKKELVIR